MDTLLLLEYSTTLSLAESYSRICLSAIDSPVSGGFWKLEEMTGESFLDELPPLQLNPAQLYCGLN